MRLLVTGGADQGFEFATLDVSGRRRRLGYRSAARSGMTPTRDRPKPDSYLVDSVFQCFTGFETWLFGSSDLQLLTGLRVTANASRTISYGESAEANQNNGITSLESSSDGAGYSVQRTLSSCFRDISGCSDSINQFRLVHSKVPLYLFEYDSKFFGESKNEC